MKTIKIFLLIIFIFLALGIFKTVKADKTVTTCQDTDGGKKQFITGVVLETTITLDDKGVPKGPAIVRRYIDLCIAPTSSGMSTTLREMYCPSRTGKAKSDKIVCKNGCTDGHCIPPNCPIDPVTEDCIDLCIDSDKGANEIHTAGFVMYNGTRYRDYCGSDATTLKEYICVDNKPAVDTQRCPTGEVCMYFPEVDKLLTARCVRSTTTPTPPPTTASPSPSTSYEPPAKNMLEYFFNFFKKLGSNIFEAIRSLR